MIFKLIFIRCDTYQIFNAFVETIFDMTEGAFTNTTVTVSLTSVFHGQTSEAVCFAFMAEEIAPKSGNDVEIVEFNATIWAQKL
jgi:hypothetical protein